MKRYEVNSIFNILNNIKNITNNLTLAHLIDINLDAMDKIIKSYDERRKELEKIEKEREAICHKYCCKDEKGEPIIENDKYKINEDKQSLFDDEIKTIVEKRKVKIEELEEFLNQEEEKKIDFIPIDVTLFPKDIEDVGKFSHLLKPVLKYNL